MDQLPELVKCALSSAVCGRASDLDGIEFLSHASNDAPGVVLMKGSLRVWTPVAA